MRFLKKLGAMLSLCCMFSQGDAVKLQFPSEEGAQGPSPYPIRILKVPYLEFREREISSKSKEVHLSPGTYRELTSSTINTRNISIIFLPKTPERDKTQTILTPHNFPSKIERLITLFTHQEVPNQHLFPQFINNLADQDPTILPWSDSIMDIQTREPIQTKKGVIGYTTRVQKSLWQPLSFFEKLSVELKSASFDTFFCLCQHNPDLEKVIRALFKEDNDLEEITFSNLLEVGRLLESVGFADISHPNPLSFRLKKTNGPEVILEKHFSSTNLKHELRKFLQDILDSQILEHLTGPPEQAKDWRKKRADLQENDGISPEALSLVGPKAADETGSTGGIHVTQQTDLDKSRGQETLTSQKICDQETNAVTNIAQREKTAEVTRKKVMDATRKRPSIGEKSTPPSQPVASGASSGSSKCTLM